MEVVKTKKGRKPKVAVRIDGTTQKVSNVQQENNQNNNTEQMTQKKNVKPSDIEEAQYVDSNASSTDSFDTENDDDLKQFITPKKDKKSDSAESSFGNNSNEIDEEALKEIEEFENKEGLNDIPSDDFDPLKESVKERGYTGGMGQSSDTQPNVAYTQQAERIIEEPKHNIASSSANKLDVDDTLINPTGSNSGGGNGDIPSGDGDIPNGGGGNNGGGNNGGGNTGNNGGGATGNSGGSSGKSEKKEKVGSDNVKELTAKEKREGVEKTADAILQAYKTYIPLPFIYFSSFNIKKLEALDENDEIDIERPIKRDGTNFRDYAKEFNAKVESVFVVTEDEVESLREPLEDVLMEQEIAFTPTQRLMFVAGQLLVAKTIACVKLNREKKSDIQDMKDMHRERMEAMEKQYQQNEKMSNVKTAQPAQQAPAENITVKKEAPVEQAPVEQKNDSEVSKTSNQVESVAEIISETKSTDIDPTPTLEDVLAMTDDVNSTDAENDIPA